MSNNAYVKLSSEPSAAGKKSTTANLAMAEVDSISFRKTSKATHHPDHLHRNQSLHHLTLHLSSPDHPGNLHPLRSA
jgi:hypothetical protein